MKNRNLLYTMTVNAALEFYQRISTLKVDDENTRFNLLMQMAKEGKFDTVVSTSRTKKQILKDFTEKHGFKVTEIKTKDKEK